MIYSTVKLVVLLELEPVQQIMSKSRLENDPKVDVLIFMVNNNYKIWVILVKKLEEPSVTDAYKNKWGVDVLDIQLVYMYCWLVLTPPSIRSNSKNYMTVD